MSIYSKIWIANKIQYHVGIDTLTMRVFFDSNDTYFHKLRKQSSKGAVFLYPKDYIPRMIQENPTIHIQPNKPEIQNIEKTSITILRATPTQVEEIIWLRNRTGVDLLKPLTREFIATYINQFHIATNEERIVGCCRIFKNNSLYEMGSLVSNEKGVWQALISYAEGLADNGYRWILAVTRNNILASILENRGWIESDLFPNRLSESAKGSKLYLRW